LNLQDQPPMDGDSADGPYASHFTLHIDRRVLPVCEKTARCLREKRAAPLPRPVPATRAWSYGLAVRSASLFVTAQAGLALRAKREEWRLMAGGGARDRRVITLVDRCAVNRSLQRRGRNDYIQIIDYWEPVAWHMFGLVCGVSALLTAWLIERCCVAHSSLRDVRQAGVWWRARRSELPWLQLALSTAVRLALQSNGTPLDVWRLGWASCLLVRSRSHADDSGWARLCASSRHVRGEADRRGIAS